MTGLWKPFQSLGGLRPPKDAEGFAGRQTPQLQNKKNPWFPIYPYPHYKYKINTSIYVYIYIYTLGAFVPPRKQSGLGGAKPPNSKIMFFDFGISLSQIQHKHHRIYIYMCSQMILSRSLNSDTYEFVVVIRLPSPRSADFGLGFPTF